MLGHLVTWKGMTRDICEYVRSCHICELCKQKSMRLMGPLQAIVPNGTGEIVAIDILGPLVKSTQGFTYVMVMVDIFSKFVELYGLRKATSRV